MSDTIDRKHAVTHLTSHLEKDKPRPAATGQKTPEPTAAGGGKSGRQPDGWRETIESIVVAFVLAFLFRTFEAEAFVIPTGSMAPTLYGQHRDVYCEKCGTRFAVGVSSGANDAEIRNGHISPKDRSLRAICPNASCRYPNDVTRGEIFAGDRILVNKFPYEFANPERWDVVVFKFPEGAKINYIKRLVALPGEAVRLQGGDVLIREPGKTTFRIARKPPEKQKHLQLLVHDNDHPARELLANGWPEAWNNTDGSRWSADPQARSFRIDPEALDADRFQWIRYTNYVPSANDWLRAHSMQSIPSRPRAQEVRDFYGYNARITAGEVLMARGEPAELTADNNASEWVGDLTLTCTVEVLDAQGDLVLELVEGYRRYRCLLNLKTGSGEMSYSEGQDLDEGSFERAGEPFGAGVGAKGTYVISFANVDDRLCVWVNDKLVKELEFNPDSRYPPPASPLRPTEADTAPAGIAARGAKLRVSHLRVDRDIYYRNQVGPGSSADRDGTYELIDSEDDAQDEFLMLGDNSPKSNDSRWWRHHAVSRRLLIGKAFFIYWPHGVPFLNDHHGYAVLSYTEPLSTTGKEGPPIPRLSLPFYPQVGRMRRIR